LNNVGELNGKPNVREKKGQKEVLHKEYESEPSIGEGGEELREPLKKSTTLTGVPAE